MKSTQLTRREIEALKEYILRGSYKLAASCMHISIKTMEKHMLAVRKKLNLYDFELVHYAISNHLILVKAYDKSGKRIGYLAPTYKLLQ